MQRYSTADRAENMEVIAPILREWLGPNGTKNLTIFVKQGKVDVELPHCDPEHDMWDGTLLVHFKQKFTPAEVINYIASYGRADEISFPSDNTLRMWWD